MGRGLVIIASRHLLGALGPEVRASTLAPLARDSLPVTRRFLVSLARWTRRPAEWAAVPPAQPPLPVTLPWPVRPLAVRAPPLEPPPGVDVFRLPRGRELDGVAPARDIPEWIAHQGLHIGWSRAAVVRPASLDSLLGFSDAAGLNVLASPLGALLPADSATASAPGGVGVWRDAIARVGATSLHWFPLLRLAASTDSAGSECLLDETAWAGGLVPALRAVAALARGRADPLAGVALELTPTDTAPPELCDSSLRAALPRLGRDSASISALLALPTAARFEALLVSGMLGPYVAALESELAARAATAAQTVRREAPELMFALWSTAPLAHWQAFGLARGFGAQERAAPVLLWDTEPLAAPILAAHRARRVTPLHAVGLAATDLSRVAPSRRTSLFTAHDGFWIGPIESFLGRSSRARGTIPADSLARLVRRISKTG